MENAFQIFQHEEFGNLRTITINGVTWFAGKDVALSLEYKDTDQAIRVNVDESDKMILKQKDIEKMASESNPVQNTGLKIDSPRGLIFINISGLFSLILSSKLPKAKEYRHWVTSEVLPSIHTKGYYISPKKENQIAVQNQPFEMKLIIAPALKDVETSVEIAERLFSVKHGIALATCINAAEKNHNVDFSAFEKLLPPAEHEIGRYTPTQLAKKFGLKSAQAVNQILLEKGLQEKDGNGGYILTEKGAEYAEAMPYERNGHTGYQIKWTPEVMEFVK